MPKLKINELGVYQGYLGLTFRTQLDRMLEGAGIKMPAMHPDYTGTALEWHAAWNRGLVSVLSETPEVFESTISPTLPAAINETLKSILVYLNPSNIDLLMFKVPINERPSFGDVHDFCLCYFAKMLTDPAMMKTLNTLSLPFDLAEKKVGSLNADRAMSLAGLSEKDQAVMSNLYKHFSSFNGIAIPYILAYMAMGPTLAALERNLYLLDDTAVLTPEKQRLMENLFEIIYGSSSLSRGVLNTRFMYYKALICPHLQTRLQDVRTMMETLLASEFPGEYISRLSADDASALIWSLDIQRLRNLCQTPGFVQLGNIAAITQVIPMVDLGYEIVLMLQEKRELLSQELVESHAMSRTIADMFATFRLMLEKLPNETDKRAFLQDVDSDAIRFIIKTNEALGSVLRKLPQAIWPTLLSLLGSERIERIIKNPADLGYVFMSLSQPGPAVFLSLLSDDFIKKIMRTAADLGTVLRALDPPSRAALIERLGSDHINRIIKNPENLISAVRNMPEGSTGILVELLGAKMVDIVAQCTDAQWSQLLQVKTIARAYKYYRHYKPSAITWFFTEDTAEGIAEFFKENNHENPDLVLFTRPALAQAIVNECEANPAPSDKALYLFLRQKLLELDMTAEHADSRVLSMKIMHSMELLKLEIRPAVGFKRHYSPW